MKPSRSLPCLCLLCVSGILLWAATETEPAGGERQLSDADLSMSVIAAAVNGPAKEPAFRVTIENKGNVDVVLNLGVMLANGRTQVPTDIGLVLTYPNGKSRELVFRGPRVGGRVDDYLVPLRSGSAYTLRISLSDLWSPDTNGGKLTFEPGEYQVRATLTSKQPHFINTDMEGVSVLNVWKGKLQSDPVVFKIGGKD